MKRDKICHITISHHETDNRIFQNECKTLVNEGYDVSYIAPNVSNKILENINIIGINCNMNPIKRVLFGAPKAYERAIEVDADIYHIHDIELYKYGIKLSKRGKKVIFDSHEDWISYPNDIVWLPYLIRKLLSWYILRMYKKNLKCYDAVIAASPHILSNMEPYTEKGHVITNYPKYDSSKIKSFSKVDYIQRQNTLFYSGTVINQEVILEAISGISNITYAIAGTFFEEYKKKLTQYSSWDKVDYFGYLGKKELEKVFDKSTIGITLLHYHANVNFKQGTLGNTKIFEYMKYGLPIVCTDFELWKKMIVDKYKCGICVNPNSIKEVHDAIQYLVKNKEIAYQMGQNAQKAIKEEFNWESQARILIRVYESLHKQRS